MTFVGKTRNMMSFVTWHTTSLAGKRIAIDEPLACRLTSAEEAKLRRIAALRTAGLSDDEIRKLLAKKGNYEGT